MVRSAKSTTKKTPQKPEQKRTAPSKTVATEMIDPRKLRPHPRNKELYGEEDVAELVARIEESEWIKPLVINEKNLVISGHRRLRAALKLKLPEIPVERRKFEDGVSEFEALLLENAVREKTIEQKIREGKAWEEIEGERARARQRTSTGGAKPQLRDTRPTAAKGRARDAVAERVGLGSGRNYQRGAQIVEAADALIKGGKEGAGKALLRIMNEDSVATALRVLKMDGEKREQMLQEAADKNADPVMHARRELGFQGFLRRELEETHEIMRRGLDENLPSNTIRLTNRFRTIVVGPLSLAYSETDPAPTNDQSIRLEDVARLPVLKLLSPKGGYLYFWTTNYMLPQVLRVVEGWGFRYQTLITWVKANIKEQTAFPDKTPYFQEVTQQLVFAVRGDDAEGLRISSKELNVAIVPPPSVEKIYQSIERSTPGPYIEIFGRYRPTKNWISWHPSREEVLQLSKKHEAQSS